MCGVMDGDGRYKRWSDSMFVTKVKDRLEVQSVLSFGRTPFGCLFNLVTLIQHEKRRIEVPPLILNPVKEG